MCVCVCVTVCVVWCWQQLTDQEASEQLRTTAADMLVTCE